MFEAGPYRAVELVAADVPELQRFFERNPEYFVNVNGEFPRPVEAQEEFDSAPPPDWPIGKRWVIGFRDGQGALAGMAHLVADMIAAGVWHVGFFLVATELQGQGAARSMYESLESWMRVRGAQWARLGVVEGNTRGERFWERCGYQEVRKRHGMATGKRTSTLRVMAKPLAHGRMQDYLSLIARDRPEAP